MKIAEAVSIAHSQRDALKKKAEAALDVDEEWTRGDTRELAELALSAAHHWKLESPSRRSAGDVLGAVIGYALLAAALLIIAALVVAAWRWAL